MASLGQDLCGRACIMEDRTTWAGDSRAQSAHVHLLAKVD